MHAGRSYFFHSEENRAAFVADPAAFAPAFDGHDPVAYIQRGEVVEGALLRRYDGRFYLLERPEHWDLFRADPARYRAE